MKKQFKRMLASALCVATVLSNCMIASAEERAVNNLALKKPVTASAEYSTMPATMAVDGIVNDVKNDRWSTEGAPEQWLQVDLKSESEITGFRIVGENDGAQRVGKFKIEGSNDGTVFEEIYQSEDKEAEGFAQDTTVTLEESVSYRYVKVTIQKLKEGAYKSVSLREFEVHGVAGQDPNENVALRKTAVASSEEAATVKASNAVDGDSESKSSRWGSGTNGAPHWIYVDLGKTMDVQTVKVFWEQRKATAYRIQVADTLSDPMVDTDWTDVKVFKDRPAVLNEEIILDEVKQARYVRLYIDSATAEDPDGGVTWNAVSIYEMEVYGGVPKEPEVTMETVIDEIAVTQPTADTTKLEVTLPEYEGFTVKYNGTDYEQVIGADLAIYKPVVTTTVKASFKVTEDATGKYKFKEIDVTVPGQYAAEENDNAAPSILPELREWKGTTGTFADAKRIMICEGLEEMAFQFKADYKEITGKDIAIVNGDTPKAGDIFFALTDDKSKGLQDEGYLMTIEADKVSVEAETATGAYWATRTILQSLKLTGDIPCGITRDYPLYKVRGFILDVGRKTFTMDFLKQIVNQMSWYKMNDFQVHLNDNYIFLENYTAAGDDPMKAYSGFRLESDIKEGGNNGLNKADLTSKDVFYTKDEFRKFIKDSRVQGVNIVPEIDTPAHSLALTKVRPDLRHGLTGRDNDHLNLTSKYDESIAFVKSIFDEYMGADLDNPVFDQETIVHMGADEYSADGNAYRRFSDDMLKYVQDSGRTARIWGSLSSIKGTVNVRSKDVQMNLWNFGWANMDKMYEEGFDLINCNDGNFYIVPNAGYYHPNGISNGEYYNAKLNSIGGVTIPAGDKQMHGAAFAIWNDMIDLKDNGVSEYYVYNLIENGFPLMGANLWGRGSKDVNTANELRNELGDAPGTNFGYEVDVDENGVIKHETFDTVQNAVNAEKVSIDGKDALKLNGEESYVKTDLTTVGLGNDLRVKVKKTSDSKEEQVLFESPYGTIKAVQKETGKVGFSRENFDYSFDYTLPVNEWVELEIKNTLKTAELYVNGELVDTLGDDEVIAGNRMLATTMFPIEKIGSETKAFEGYVDDVRLGTAADYASTMELDYAAVIANALLKEIDNAELSSLLEEADAVFAKFAPTAEEVQALADQIYAIIDTVEFEEADYSRVNAYLTLIPEDVSVFTAQSVARLNAVVAGIKEGLPKSMQDTVDGYEKQLADALSGLEVKQGSNVNYVDNATLKATADSYHGGEEADKAIDGNLDTMWHCDWNNTTMPHWIDLEMAKPAAVNALTYIPRQSGPNGILKKYKVQISDDGINYTDVKEGTVAQDNTTKVISFDAVTAKHIRLLFVEAGGNFGSAVEIKLHLAEVSADLDGLNAVIEKAETIKNQGFTEETWNALQDKIAEAKALAGNADADANDVENMKRALSDSMTSLVLEEKQEPTEPEIVDKEALEALIKYAQEQKEGASYVNVIPIIKAAFENALADAIKVDADAKATQKEVDAAYDKLLKVTHMLDYVAGDKTELQELVKDVNEMDEEQYTADSWAAVEEALAKAREVLADENAMQKEIDAAKDALQAAVDALEEKEPVEPDVVDKSDLEEAIKEAEAIDKDKYTDETVKDLVDAIENGKEVLADEGATQEEVDAAEKAIEDAVKGLEEKEPVEPDVVDKSDLEEAIKEAEALDKDNYTEESWKDFEDALEDAKDVFADEDATQEEVDNALKALEDAKDALVKKEEPGKPGPEEPDPEKPDKPGKPDGGKDDETPTTGDPASAAGAVVMLLGSAMVIAKRKREDEE